MGVHVVAVAIGASIERGVAVRLGGELRRAHSRAPGSGPVEGPEPASRSLGADALARS